MNNKNFGIATGRLTADPKIFENADGSKKVRATIAVQNNYRDKTGARGTTFIPVEAFVGKDAGQTVYDLLAKGMLVAVDYEVRNNNWTDKDEVQHYDVILQANSVSILETKAVTDARKKKAAAAEAEEPVEEAPAEDAEA